MILGIDFGTCFSSVAVMIGGSPCTNLLEDPDNTGIPSVFMYDNVNNKNLYGYEVTTGSNQSSEQDIVRYVKRLIRANPRNLNREIISGGKSFTYREIISNYLKYLITNCINRANQSSEINDTTIEYITITVPCGISSGQMLATNYNEILKNIVSEITDVNPNNIYILEEPVAAAISYFYNNNTINKKQNILVFDLGGGTLDVSIVEYNPATNHYKVKNKRGDLSLGGNEWNSALEKYVLKKNHINEEDFSNLSEKYNFSKQMLRLKLLLSNEKESSYVFKHNRKVIYDDSFSRKEFEKASDELLNKAIYITEELIRSSDESIDKILLVGGASQMPQIINKMIDKFSYVGRDNIILHNSPSKATAQGAAIYAQIRQLNYLRGVQQINVTDVSSYTYGIKCKRTSGDKSDDKLMIYNILYKGKTFENGEIRVERHGFSALNDTQEEAEFNVYESQVEEHELKDNFMEMDKGQANGMSVTVEIPKEYYGKATEYKYSVIFSLSEDHILKLIVKDEKGNEIVASKKVN